MITNVIPVVGSKAEDDDKQRSNWKWKTNKARSFLLHYYQCIQWTIVLTPTDQGSLENIILHALSQHDNQLHVEIYSLRRHYHERHQEEVLEQSGHRSTQGRNDSAMDGTYEHGVETQQGQAKVDQ